tara:strand:- start:1914 stop:2276 length:363 start_codon:yes stop_codon:yes gene_type:complete
MSLLNLSNLANEHPEYEDVWAAIKQYARSHPAASYIPVRKVLRELRRRDPLDVLNAFEILVETGLSKRVFIVVLPATGDVVGDVYDSVSEVPEVVDGTFDEQIRTAEAEIIPCYTLGDDG